MYQAAGSVREGGLGFYGIVILSLLAHVLVISLLAMTPSLLPSPSVTFGPTYDVQLVSMPTDSPDNKAAETTLNDILAGLPAQQPSLPKATLETSATVYSHSRASGKKAEESIENALETMRKNLASAASSHVPPPSPAPAPRIRADQTTSPSSPPANEGDLHVRMRLYYAQIWARIKGLWTIPRGLIPQENIESVVNVQILRDGTIAHVSLEKGSGNRYFDESALRTVKKANPLPPLPEAFREDGMEVGIRFRSSEFR